MEETRFEIHELNEGRLEETVKDLRKRLPFSVNMLSCLLDYKERCRVIEASEGKYTAGVLVEFNSTYNRHIWLDPIIWITGRPEVASSLIQKRGYEPSIIVSESNFSTDLPEPKPETKVYEEYILCANLDNIGVSSNRVNGVTRKLIAEDARDSLHLSGYRGDEINPETIRREENFLNERICLGHYAEGHLVSRGAIMSVTEDYATVGAFLTLEGMRNLGYGSTVVSEALKEASLHSRNACLFVRSSNKTAISIYKRLGLEICGKAYFTDLGTGSVP